MTVRLVRPGVPSELVLNIMEGGGEVKVFVDGWHTPIVRFYTRAGNHCVQVGTREPIVVDNVLEKS